MCCSVVTSGTSYAEQNLLNRPHQCKTLSLLEWSPLDRQLEPVKGSPLYSPFHSDKKWINSINCYVELLGLHRFREDPEWGLILSRLRNDTYTQHDIDAINQCCIQVIPRTLPGNASYCVYGNADRTAINAGIFSNVLKAHWQTSQSLPKHIVAITAGNMISQKEDSIGRSR